jgi:hypothetical protein
MDRFSSNLEPITAVLPSAREIAHSPSLLRDLIIY